MEFEHTVENSAFVIQPQRSKLYQLIPCGVGTSNVESLTSYITRLAEAHSVSVGSLVGKYLTQFLMKPYLAASAKFGGSRFYDRSLLLNGMSATARHLTDILGDLTGNTYLDQLTMLRWAGVFSSRGLMKEVRAWCPCCFEEMLQFKQTVYEPLLWSLRNLEICPIHFVRLISNCPQCGRTSSALMRNSVVGFCPKCGVWLGRRNTNLVDKDSQFNQVVWNTFAITTLLAEESNTCVEFSSAISIISEELCEGNLAELARRIKIPKVTLWDWKNRNVTPSLEQLLSLSYRLKISLIDLLKNSHANFEQISIRPSECSMTKFIKRRRTVDWKRVQQLLQGYVVDESKEQFSMQKIASELGFNKRLLYKHFPDDCKLIAARHTEYIRRQRDQKWKEICTEVTEITINLLKSGQYPSRRAVERMSCDSALLRSKYAKDQWNSLKLSDHRQESTNYLNIRS